MHIVVCIKQVPDSDKVTIDRETNRLNRAGVPSIISPFDENALEMGLQLRDKNGGKVTVITMGPPQAEQVLRTSLGLGADEVVLLSDRAFGGSDTWSTSYALSQAIRKMEDVDVILFGKQAIDGDTAQVGPGVAHFLDMPIVTTVVEVQSNGETLDVKRTVEDGFEMWNVDTPAAFSVVKEANIPRMASLKLRMKAKKAAIPTWTAADVEADVEKLGLKGSPTKVKKVFAPPVKLNRELLSGEPAEMVESLIHKLKERKVL